MLTEIEHKVASLLEHCRDQSLGDHGAIQQEAEALALKLKTVKCNLEKVQLVLQEKHSEDQVRCGCAQTCVQMCGYGRPIRNELWTETLKQLQGLSRNHASSDCRGQLHCLLLLVSFCCAVFLSRGLVMALVWFGLV